VPRLRSIDRFLSRHRRTTAAVGVLIVLGVAALNTHEALPEHHHQHGEATMCLASLSIAVLATMGLLQAKHVATPTTRLGETAVRRSEIRLAVATPSAAARAGPCAPTVLRL
jgi:hypothetical protein